MTGCVDSILKPNLYKDFYQHLKQYFGKPWIWNRKVANHGPKEFTLL